MQSSEIGLSKTVRKLEFDDKIWEELGTQNLPEFKRFMVLFGQLGIHTQ